VSAVEVDTLLLLLLLLLLYDVSKLTEIYLKTTNWQWCFTAWPSVFDEYWYSWV